MAARPNSHIVIGLGYGDEGKGSWVDHLARKTGAGYIVRFNGGAQAAHHVVTEDGRFHCFHQFGSAMFVPAVKTILSSFMLIEPELLLSEAADLEKKGVPYPLNRIIISANAPIITPFNRLLNQIQEVYRGQTRHGSCGLGIGITQGDVELLGAEALYAGDLTQPVLQSKMEALWARRRQEAQDFESPETAKLLDQLNSVDINYYAQLFSYFASRVQIVPDEEVFRLISCNDTIFEGAQGVLLDQQFGTFPHCTRSNCSSKNALSILRDANFAGTVKRIGLARAYSTRHGEGPLITEDNTLSVPGCHNQTNQWQGRFRIGWLDAVALRYALKNEVSGGVDVLAITNLDRLNNVETIKVADRYFNTKNPYFDHTGEYTIPDSYDLEWLRARTDSMYEISPGYAELKGCDTADQEAVRSHLAELSQFLNYEISAYSATPLHKKSYLV
jgi:adenylosuccinate synthase